ncbi:hypothetical protein H0H93_004626 [Arthromyces matolae]|nr:hypothetical protein H0H93_004626 [Arthromyces matolae]
MPANTQPSSLPNPSPPLLPDEYLVRRPTQGGGGPLSDPLSDSSVQAIPGKMASPKLSAVIDMIIAKMKDPHETRIRQACEEIWGSLDPLTHLDSRPQIVLGWTESKRPPSLGMVDPEYPEDICVAYHLIKTLEDKEVESDGEVLFRFLSMATLLHELVHWCRRRGNSGASTPNGAEGGKRAEMIIFGVEVQFIGEARGDPQLLATEEINRSLLLTQATAVGFRGEDGVVRVQSRERLMGYGG